MCVRVFVCVCVRTRPSLPLSLLLTFLFLALCVGIGVCVLIRVYYSCCMSVSMYVSMYRRCGDGAGVVLFTSNGRFHGVQGVTGRARRQKVLLLECLHLRLFIICVSVYIYLYMYTCIYVYIHIHIYDYLNAFMCACASYA